MHMCSISMSGATGNDYIIFPAFSGCNFRNVTSWEHIMDIPVSGQSAQLTADCKSLVSWSKLRETYQIIRR